MNKSAFLAAAADIGSNSARLLLARVTNNNNSPALERVLTMRFVTRLGETPGTLSNGGVERTLCAIDEFIKALSPYGSTPFFVFATSAVRDAGNQDALLEPLKERGVRVDILSGEREAELSIAGLPETGGCIDIGGGSTELLSRSGGKTFCKSFNIGAVRAKALFGEENGVLPLAFYDWLKGAFANIRTEIKLPEPVYGTGGTLTTLAALAHGAKAYVDSALTRAQLARVMAAIAKTPHAERRKNPFLSDRADIILYGAGILAYLMDELGVENVFATEKDNLYAYLFEMYKTQY